MPRIVFHHIDKCSGTTLLKYLGNMFSPDESLFVENHYNMHSAGSLPLDANVLARTKFVHDPFGVCSWLDRLAHARTFTLLRDPLDRLVSNWWMINRWTDAEAGQYPDGAFVRNLAREAAATFFSSQHPQVQFLNWNRITRHLACVPHLFREAWRDGKLADAEFRSDLLKRAEYTLRSMSFIGFQDDFDRSLAGLQLWLALPPDTPQSFNIHHSGQRQVNLTGLPGAVESELIDLDREIVSIARELYEQQMDGFAKKFGADLRAAALQAYVIANTQHPGWEIVDASRPLHGTGWHHREINGTKLSRWIGPGPIATMDIVIRKDRGLFMRFRVTNALSTVQLDMLCVHADGTKIDTHRWMESTHVICFDCIISAEYLDQSDTMLHLSFDCVETVVHDPKNDGRKIGIEICEIEVGPIGEFKLMAPGTPQRTHIGADEAIA